MQLDESIPETLRPPAEAAVSWINETQNQQFELTGLVDYEQALGEDARTGYELGLVLCDGEICVREQVRIQSTDEGYQFSLIEASAREIPPLLDPPEGIRSEWLAGELAKHEFAVLLFYRGLW
ncbi:MAG: hypothetical protein AAF512_15910 [Pseudomonadota bacterium]